MAQGAANSLLLGRYRIMATLGSGAFGEVVQAWDTRIGRFVAIKSLRHSLIADPYVFGQARDRFTHEAEAASRMGLHPNIVGVYDLTVDADGTLYLILEYLPSGTLADRLKQGPVPLTDALRWIADAAQGLHAAHQHGIVHRDIKPSNLFLTAEGRVKVGDFGIAQMDDLSARSRVVIGHPGTPLYMSPEQERTTAYLRLASDEYSLGVVLFELLTGTRFKQLSERERQELLRRMPRRVRTVVERMTAAEPDARYRTLNEAVEALEEAQREMPTRKVDTPPGRRKRRWHLPVYATAGVGVILLITALLVKLVIPGLEPAATATRVTTATRTSPLTATAFAASAGSLPTATKVPVPTATIGPTAATRVAPTATPIQLISTPAQARTPIGVSGNMYTDPQGRYSFIIPQGWRIQQPSDAATDVQAMPPSTLQGILRVASDSIGPGTSLDDYVTSTMSYFKSDVSNYQPLLPSVQNLSISGHDARRFDFTGSQNGTDLRGAVFIVQKDLDMYVLLVAAVPLDFDAVLAQARIAVDSFTVL